MEADVEFGSSEAAGRIWGIGKHEAEPDKTGRLGLESAVGEGDNLEGDAAATSALEEDLLVGQRDGRWEVAAECFSFVVDFQGDGAAEFLLSDLHFGLTWFLAVRSSVSGRNWEKRGIDARCGQEELPSPDPISPCRVIGVNRKRPPRQLVSVFQLRSAPEHDEIRVKMPQPPRISNAMKLRLSSPLHPHQHTTAQ